MHHVALDRAGADDRDLHHQVVEIARLEARQHAHLRPAFHLEHADGIRLAQHVVDFGLFRRDVGEGQLLAAAMLVDQVEALADAGQHAERQHIDLQHAQGIEIVLVPFDDGAVLHRRILDRHIVVEAAAGDDEAADMLRQMAREADQRSCEREHLAQARLIGIEAGLADMLLDDVFLAPAPDRLREAIEHVLAEAEHLADVAQGALRAIGDDRGGEAGAMAAVFPVDVLDDLFAPLMLEIDVDVRRLVALGRDEALEQQIDLDRVDRRDAQAIADHRVRRRAAALAENAFALREPHDVVHRQEIGRVVQLADQRQLLRERLAHLARHAFGIALRGALPGQLLQMLLRCQPIRHRLARIFVAQLVEREAAGIGQLRGILQRLRPAPEQALHLVG